MTWAQDLVAQGYTPEQAQRRADAVAGTPGLVVRLRADLATQREAAEQTVAMAAEQLRRVRDEAATTGQLLDDCRRQLAQTVGERDDLRWQLAEATAQVEALTRQRDEARAETHRERGAAQAAVEDAEQVRLQREQLRDELHDVRTGHAPLAGLTDDADLDVLEDALHVAGRVGGTQDTRAHARELQGRIHAARTPTPERTPA